jgi:hypothetical protein
MDRECGMHDREGECIGISLWETWSTKKFKRQRYGWKDNINMHLKDIGWKSAAWIRVAGWCEHGNEQLGCMACGALLIR